MSLFSIAPSTPFLPCLVAAIMDGRLLGDWPRSGPFWLSDVTVIVPTQRARQALAASFADHPDFLGLLPDIRTFGGEAGDEEPFLPPFDTAPLPPAASDFRRRLTLSHLVAGWARSERGRQAFSSPPGAAEIFSMSASLGRLIDDLIIEEQRPEDIAAIGAELGPDLGDYWLQTLDFLNIALAAWPAHLKILGLADPAMQRRLRLDRQAMATRHLYGERPVIAAGSTGSIPATARLLKAIADLPRGAVVLPGLDLDMTPATHEALLGGDDNPHGHPQYGLAHLLRHLGAGPAQVIELCANPSPRTGLVNRALALTEETGLWSGQRLDAATLATALAGVNVIAARNEDEEARAVALASRAALEAENSVGIITPDRNLARRIAAELRRFDIVVDDAAGAPLFHSPAGRLARQVLALVSGQYRPVDLMALLRNRAVVLDQDRTALSTLAEKIDLGLLRGQRPAPGLAGLRALLAGNLDGSLVYPALRLDTEEAAAITSLFDRLEHTMAPLAALLDTDRIDAGLFALALAETTAALTPAGPLMGREELMAWAEQMGALAHTGHAFAPHGLDAVLFALMDGVDVRNREARRQDIAIWGQIEARLMSPALVILAGLNEDKWPGPADPGPWLSRGMRIKAGLEPPERMQGLAAHDFAQGMGNADVIVSYADRVGASPALPSRLVQRLDAFIGTDAATDLRRRGRHFLEQARRLDAVAEVKPATRPAQSPPVDKRPRKLSVTEIETLMRSPYDIYAKHVLGLKPLDALGTDPDARERGNIIHDILGRFIEDGHDPLAPQAHDVLMDLARLGFSGLDAIGERRDIWLKRFSTTASQFLDYERTRAPFIAQRHAEKRGEWLLPLGGGFTITGRADRVDELQDGTLEIIDFKTGSPPDPGAMKGFEAPQLLVEALMAEVGAIADVAAARSSALTYIKIGLGPDAFVPKPFKTPDDMSVMDAAEEVGNRMQGHIEHFLFRDTLMYPRLMPLKSQRFAGPYDHLSRLAEWTAIDGEDEP
ncbi:MAG: double-strand break repair protein AddB [Devosia sp.]|uniref:double-strand break repair protein AddB n=1 Tax=Devosia sp. TaxID=1871048 RepID=UPI0024C6E3C5|nr:double-strand break repair protein AddB [Devosia sp.]UYN98845.1 MAG: double-strand break repair protein AddB [Devosia sp.]